MVFEAVGAGEFDDLFGFGGGNGNHRGGVLNDDFADFLRIEATFLT